MDQVAHRHHRAQLASPLSPQTPRVHLSNCPAPVSFIGIYIQGAKKVDGPPGWNTGDTVVPGQGVDDMGFIQAVAATFKLKYDWDARAYCYGTSNGGAMCQRIGVNGPMGFAAIAPVCTQLLLMPTQGGPVPLNYNQPGSAAETSPLGYISFHGSADTTIPYTGGGLFGSTTVVLDTVVHSNQLWALHHLSQCEQRNGSAHRSICGSIYCRALHLEQLPSDSTDAALQSDEWEP